VALLFAPQVKATFDFRPGMMGKALDLKRGGNR
jgi:S-adenosylmethionine synthetase